jgi:hypothetical protein
MHKIMTVKMLDGSVWGVSVETIARNRATYYAKEFDGDVERSLKEDTVPLFESSEYEIQDWALGNMDWSDFDGHQIKISDALPPDFQEGWMRGDIKYLD